jgi:hypothetical protein
VCFRLTPLLATACERTPLSIRSSGGLVEFTRSEPQCFVLPGYSCLGERGQHVPPDGSLIIDAVYRQGSTTPVCALPCTSGYATNGLSLRLSVACKLSILYDWACFCQGHWFCSLLRVFHRGGCQTSADAFRRSYLHCKVQNMLPSKILSASLLFCFTSLTLSRFGFLSIALSSYISFSRLGFGPQYL